MATETPATEATEVHEIDIATEDMVLDRGVTDLAIDGSNSYCAVGRDSGSIEIYGLKTGFNLMMVLTAKDNKKNVRGLVWLGEFEEKESFPRLFSYGLDGYLREWDLMRQREQYVLDSYGGAVWCGTLISPKDQPNSLLVLGCEDGTARLFDIPEDDEPVYTKAYSCNGIDQRVLSLCWNDTATVLFVGTIGSIQMFKKNEPGPYQRINMERESRLELPCVHALAYLPDGLLASASSRGSVEIWDPVFGTRVRAFVAHKADVLALCSGHFGTTHVLYAGGIDPKIVEFVCKEDGTWGDSITTTINDCDVRVLKVFKRCLGSVKGQDIMRHQVISGNSAGVITIIDPVRTRFTTAARIHPTPTLMMCEVGRNTLMLTNGTSSLSLWTYKDKKSSFLLRMNPRLGRGIKLTALCGKWIAVADGEIVKIWSFKLRRENQVQVQKFCVAKTRATAISFTKNEEGLLIGMSSGQVSYMDLTKDFEQPMAPDEAIKPMFKLEEPVKQLVNSGVLYTCALGLFGTIMLYCKGATSIIPNNEVSGRITNTLFFHAFIPKQLFCIQTDRTFRIWNLDRMKESSWSETQSDSIPHHPFGQQFFGHPVNCLAFHPSKRGRVVLNCPEFFSPVDLGKALPKPRPLGWKRGVNAAGFEPRNDRQKKAALNRTNGKDIPKEKIMARHEELNKDIRNPFNEDGAASRVNRKPMRKDLLRFRGYQFAMGAFYIGNKDLVLPQLPWKKFRQYYPRRAIQSKYGT